MTPPQQTANAPLRLATLIAAGVAVLILPLRSVAQQAAPPPADQPASPPVEEETVTMGTFRVTTEIGTYHEEVSAMATKIPTDVKELPSSLEILNATAIGDRDALTLPDIFLYVVGATQSQAAINGFSFRGFPNTGTFTQNIEFDGLMGATLKKGASSSADVDSLEFLKGPNSVLYGQMHPGGLLNIVTKSPLDVRQTVVKVSFGTYAGGYSNFGDKFLSDYVLDTTGPIDAGKHLLYRIVADYSSSPPSRTGDFDRAFSVYPSFTYQWSRDSLLTIKLESSADYRRQDDGLVPIFTGPAIPEDVGNVLTPTAAYGSAAKWYVAPYQTVYEDPTDSARDKGDAFSAVFQTKVDGWNIQAQNRVVWHTDITHEFTVNNASSYTPKATYATPTSTLARQYNLQDNGHRYDYSDANAYRTFGPDSFKNTVIVGVAGGQEFSNNTRYAFGPNVTPAVTLVNPILGQSPYPPNGTATQSPRTTLSAFGQYLNDQIVIIDRIHVLAGVRHDQQIAHGIDLFNPTKTPYASQSVKSVTGQGGVVFDVTKTLSWYASFSQSVLPNSVTSIDAEGDSSFAPEKGLQYESGLKYQTIDRNFYTTLAAYWIDRSNVLVSTGTTLPVTGQAIFRLDGDQHSEGIEVESQYQPRPFWQLQGGVALGKAFVAASAKNPYTVGDDLINAPRASGNLWTRFNVPTGTFKGLGIGAGYIYVGKSWSGDPTTTLYYNLPGWVRLDGALYYNWKNYTFTLNGKNLLDRRYILSSQSAITLNPAEVRTLIFSASMKF